MGNSGSSEQSGKRQTRYELPDGAQQSTSQKKYSRARGSLCSQARLSQSHRQILRGCISKAKIDIADRIYRRICEKRDDFKTFLDALTDNQRADLCDSLHYYLQQVGEQMDDANAIQRISEQFGGKHVQYRLAGFRPDFFALTADAVTTEFVLLDGATHSATDALTAWSALTSRMFSSVRDGYYNEQRRLRKTSQVSVTSSGRKSSGCQIRLIKPEDDWGSLQASASNEYKPMPRYSEDRNVEPIHRITRQYSRDSANGIDDGNYHNRAECDVDNSVI